MTDKEKLEALLKDFGVEFTSEKDTILIEAGYPGFYTEFGFTAEGKFEHVGAYE